MKTTRRLLVIWVWLLAALLLLSPQSLAQNVIMIVMDDVGTQDMTSMPLVSSYASFGRVHTNYHTCSICSPSRYGLQFGRWNYDSGIGGALSLTQNNAYMKGAPTGHTSLAEVMSVAGYQTAFFGKWHISGLATVTSNDGPRIHGYQVQRAMNMSNLNSHYNWSRTDDQTTTNETRFSSEVITDEFISWWNGTAGLKMASINYFAPHEPYQYPPGYSGPNTNRAKFEAMLDHLDKQLTRLLSVDLTNTLIVLVSDNGTPGNALPPVQLYQGYKNTSYEGGINTPLIIWGPGVTPGQDTSLVSFIDVPARILDCVGLPIPSSWEGSAAPRQYHMSHLFTPISGTLPSPLVTNRWAVIRDDGWKLIDTNGVREMYNIITDPFEMSPRFLPTVEMDLQGFYDQVTQ